MVLETRCKGKAKDMSIKKVRNKKEMCISFDDSPLVLDYAQLRKLASLLNDVSWRF